MVDVVLASRGVVRGDQVRRLELDDGGAGIGRRCGTREGLTRAAIEMIFLAACWSQTGWVGVVDWIVARVGVTTNLVGVRRIEERIKADEPARRRIVLACTEKIQPS